jgi:hypothetical protein
VRSSAKLRIRIPAVIVLAAWPALLRGQQSASIQLREEAQRLQQEIDVLKQSKSELASRASASFLSSLNSEILAKEASLEKIRQAQTAQTEVDTLTHLKAQILSSASADFLSAINRELSRKQQTLAALAQARPAPGVVLTNDDPTPPTESDATGKGAANKVLTKDANGPSVAPGSTAGLVQSKADAPAICSDKITAPCIYQPVASGDMFGKGWVPKGNVNLVLNSKSTEDKATVQPDGSFRIRVNADQPLKEYDVVEVDEQVPAGSGGQDPKVGPVAVVAQTTCETKTTVPCFNELRAGDDSIMGKVGPGGTQV